MKEYNTRQRSTILSFFRSHSDRSFSIQEAVGYLSDAAGKSTVYRIIPRLVDEGYLMRIPSDDNESSFQYRDPGKCPGHMHMRCVSCGRIFHLDDSLSSRLAELIRDGNGFSLMNTSILEGLCPDCREKDI